MPVTAGQRRAVMMVKEALERKGHEVVPFSIDEREREKFNDSFIALISNAYLGTLMNVLDDHYEERMPIYKLTSLLYRSPFLSYVVGFFLRMTG